MGKIFRMFTLFKSLDERQQDWAGVAEVRARAQEQMKTKCYPAYRWLILTIATWSQAVSTLVTYGVGPLAAIWQKQWGLNALEAGLFVSAVQLGPLLSMLLIGQALDRYGERWLISMGSVLLGFTFIFVAFAGGYFLLLILLGIVGIWYGTAQPGGSKVILKWFSKGERGLAMGIRQAGIPIGGAMGGALLPFLSYRFGWQAAVYVQAFLAISGGILFLLFYREPPVSEERKKQGTYKFRQQLAEIWVNRKIRPILYTGITMVSLQMVIVGHLMIFFMDKAKVSVVTAGQLLSTALLFGMIGRIALAWLSDQWWGGNREAPLHLSIWASVAGIVLLIFVSPSLPVWSLFILSAWFGFFGTGWYSSFLLAVAEQSPPQAEGLMVSFALTLNQLAIILAPVLFGFMADVLSYTFAWSLLGGTLIGMGIFLAKKGTGEENKITQS
jgi:MFS family permease